MDTTVADSNWRVSKTIAPGVSSVLSVFGAYPFGLCLPRGAFQDQRYIVKSKAIPSALSNTVPSYSRSQRNPERNSFVAPVSGEASAG